MKKKRFAIERRDLAACPTTELKRMAHYAHVVGETIAEACITSEVEMLADLEESIEGEIAEISAVLIRVERRIAKELATRK